MTAAIWSTPPDDAALEFPTATLVRFMHNHHLLTVLDRPQWLTIKGGSKQYVDSILARLGPHQFHRAAPVVAVDSVPGAPLVVHTADGTAHGAFDHVVLACHADQSLAILRAGEGGATAKEEALLGAFRFAPNVAVLHADLALMPVRRPAYAAWNYLARTGPDGKVNEVALTYWMNLLQSIPEAAHGPVLVTLNPPFAPDPAKTVATYEYEHPQFTTASVAAQAYLPGIQHRPERRLSFAGAWTKYGFHEDGWRSGLLAAAPFCALPYDVVPAERAHAPTHVDGALVWLVTALDLWRRLLVCLWDIACAVVPRPRHEVRAKTA